MKKQETKPIIKGYKGFDKDFKCRDMQFAENSEYKENVTPVPGGKFIEA